MDKFESDKHLHQDENGFLVACYHKCRVVFSLPFWLGVTFSFPIEHFLWEKVWPFSFIGHWLGL